MRTISAAILGTCVLLSVVGCHQPARPVSATQAVVDVSDFDGYVDATLTLLRERDFHPRRVDRRQGKIQAGPTTGAQWFEFWRRDSQGGYQVFESSLHTIRRSVTVTITPTDAMPAAIAEPPSVSSPPEPLTDMEVMTPVSAGPVAPVVPVEEPDESMPTSGRFIVTVQVDKFRDSMPERQVTTASGALGIYSERLPTTDGLRAARGTGGQRVPLGRDALLETDLLSEIINLTPHTPAGE